MLPLQRRAEGKLKNFEPEFILVDSAYDSYDNYKAIVEEFRAIPIIDLNIRHTQKGQTRNILGLFDYWYNERGTV
ncbi:MAG: hypothetical protein MUP49_04330 [Dehalococcoidia bacterium]|nr:hypothetical protein [Dehalococcoidia bacterium]